MMHVNEYIIKYLEKIGITHIFGVGGANIEDIYDAAYHYGENIEAVLAKHEEAAAFMADGYTRTTNNLGVVMATSGGGALNTIPGLGESFTSHSPILAIIGQPPLVLEGDGAFQDTSGLSGSINGNQLFGAVASKYFKRINSSDNFQRFLFEAITAALSEPMGTSILLINKDIQVEKIDDSNQFHFKLPKKNLIQLNDDSKNKLAQLTKDILNLSKDKSILVIVGDEVIRHDQIKATLNFIDLIDANVALTPKAASVIDHDDERFVGITGIASHTTVLETLKQTDLVIVVGSSLSLLTRIDIQEELASHQLYFISDLLPHFVDKAADNVCVINTNLGKAIEKLLAQIHHVKAKDNILIQHNRVIPKVDKLPAKAFSEATLSDFNFKTIFESFNEFIEDNAAIYIDAGNTGAAALHYLSRPKHGTIEIALGMGGMGYAIGSGIGAAFASQKPVYIFAGDGAFYMHGLELHTAVQYQLPVRLVIFNNNAHGMCYTREKLYYKGKYTYNRFKTAHIGDAMQTLFPDIYAKDIDNLAQLKDTLLQCVDIKGPVCLSLTTEIEELPPFSPFLSLYQDNRNEQS